MGAVRALSAEGAPPYTGGDGDILVHRSRTVFGGRMCCPGSGHAPGAARCLLWSCRLLDWEADPYGAGYGGGATMAMRRPVGRLGLLSSRRFAFARLGRMPPTAAATTSIASTWGSWGSAHAPRCLDATALSLVVLTLTLLLCCLGVGGMAAIERLHGQPGGCA